MCIPVVVIAVLAQTASINPHGTRLHVYRSRSELPAAVARRLPKNFDFRASMLAGPEELPDGAAIESPPRLERERERLVIIEREPPPEPCGDDNSPLDANPFFKGLPQPEELPRTVLYTLARSTLPVFLVIPERRPCPPEPRLPDLRPQSR